MLRDSPTGAAHSGLRAADTAISGATIAAT